MKKHLKIIACYFRLNLASSLEYRSSFLTQAFGIGATDVNDSTFAVSRTDAGGTAAAPWTYRVVAGGIAGAICFIGLSLLLHRRIFDPRIRLTSHRTDLAILVILWVQLVIGLTTLPSSLHHVADPQFLCGEIHRHFGLRMGLDDRPQSFHDRLVDQRRQQSVLASIAAEDVGEHADDQRDPEEEHDEPDHRPQDLTDTEVCEH